MDDGGIPINWIAISNFDGCCINSHDERGVALLFGIHLLALSVTHPTLNPGVQFNRINGI